MNILKITLIVATVLGVGQAMANSAVCLKKSKKAALNQAYAESDNQYLCKVVDAGILEPATYYVNTICSNKASYNFEVTANETTTGCKVAQILRVN